MIAVYVYMPQSTMKLIQADWIHFLVSKLISVLTIHYVLLYCLYYQVSHHLSLSWNIRQDDQISVILLFCYQTICLKSHKAKFCASSIKGCKLLQIYICFSKKLLYPGWVICYVIRILHTVLNWFLLFCNIALMQCNFALQLLCSAHWSNKCVIIMNFVLLNLAQNS